MPIVIQPFREEHQPAVKAFNQRLRAATTDPNLVFYGRSNPSWLPRIEGSPLYNEYFIALEDGEVRGAYALKYEKFFLAGHCEYTVACYHHPLSEGIVDRKYSTVGGLLLRDALRREPMLYALGMGGFDRPLPQMLKAVGWTLHLIPFYFRVVHPYRFLRGLSALRQTPWRRLLMDLSAFTGSGWASITAAQNLKRLRGTRAGSFEAVEVEEFSDWADLLWLEARGNYRLASVRDAQTLKRLYPVDDCDLTKLCVKHAGKPVGWAVVGERRKDAKFGTLRVGSIVDCWARPENAASVILAATHSLERQGMDLIVTNQNHREWGRALKICGFFAAESNFIFAASKKHSALLHPGDWSDFHLTRANGDGLPRNF
jgi:hypothetical protein